jgi:uncharacterized protein
MIRSLLLAIATLICCESYALKPVRKYEVVPDSLRLPYEKNIITTHDQIKLKSWTFLPREKADNHTTLVLAYADAGNMSWWLSQATILTQAGFTVVMFDYRGFGESDPFTIDPKMLYYNEFAADLTAAIQFAKKKYPSHKTGVWAFSMGTVITTLASRYVQPDFIIGEGYVTDPIKIQSFYAKKDDNMLLPPGAKDYEKVLMNIKVPMLVFSGNKDMVTTTDAIKKFMSQKTSVSMISFDGGHMEGFSVLSKEFPGSVYVRHIKDFLKLD